MQIHVFRGCENFAEWRGSIKAERRWRTSTRTHCHSAHFFKQGENSATSLMKLVTTLPKTTKLCYIREHTHESTGAEQAALARHWRCSAWNNFGHEMNFSSSHCKNWGLMMEIFSPWSFGCCVWRALLDVC